MWEVEVCHETWEGVVRFDARVKGEVGFLIENNIQLRLFALTTLKSAQNQGDRVSSFIRYSTFELRGIYRRHDTGNT